MNARRAAGCVLAVVALAGCAVPGRYRAVPVAPWNPTKAPWNSTLSGVADHNHVVGGYETLARINDISNPFLVKPGELIKVPRRRAQSDNQLGLGQTHASSARSHQSRPGVMNMTTAWRQCSYRWRSQRGRSAGAQAPGGGRDAAHPATLPATRFSGCR